MQSLMQLHLLQLTGTSHIVQQSAAVKAGGGRLQRASATDAFTRSEVTALSSSHAELRADFYADKTNR